MRRQEKISWENGGVRAPVRALVRFSYFLAALAVMGCSLFNTTDLQNDPLKGSLANSVGQAPATTTNKQTVLPIPEPQTFTTTADLAVGGLPGSRELSIQPGAQENSGWQEAANAGKETQDPPPSSWKRPNIGISNPGILLKQPIPVKPAPAPNVPQPQAQNKAQPQDKTVVHTGMVTTNSPPTSPERPSSYEEWQDALKKRGVTWQRQETTDQGVKFTCAIPDPQNPNRQRVYEATANDYLSAIRLVVEQIDRQKKLKL